MIRGIIEMTFNYRHSEQGPRALRALAGLIRSQEGCHGCQLQRDLIDEGQVHFTSEWGTRNDIENYMRSDVFRSFLSIMDLSATPPVITFETVSNVETDGMEYIEAVRRSSPDEQPREVCMTDSIAE
jgi:quinol monooxygenase YgiN